MYSDIGGCGDLRLLNLIDSKSDFKMQDSSTSAIDQLAEFFHRNGCVRRHDPERRRTDGPQKYKKGDEIRLTANSRTELRLIRKLLKEAGFKPGRAFTKGKQFRQPVYGRESTARFLGLVGDK